MRLKGVPRDVSGGLFVTSMVTAALIAILFAAWKIAGLPFAPFDSFDWLTRVLPGKVLAFGIGTMVAVIRALHLGATSETAKTAEHAMAIAGSFVVGVAGGAILFSILRSRPKAHPIFLGLVIGIILAIPATLISVHASGTTAVHPAQRAVWILVAFLGWGAILGRVVPPARANSCSRWRVRGWILAVLYSRHFPPVPICSQEQAMASTSAVPVRGSRIRAKYVIFIALGLMFLFVLWHNERFVFDHSSDDWAYFFPVRWFIVPHALAGLAALLIGPFQLSTRFRQRHLRVHRIMGRFYLVGIAIAAIIGIYLAATHQQQPQDKLWVYALAVTWLITGFLALAAIRNGNTETHQQWMTRNYAFTCAFITARIQNAFPIPEKYGNAPGWILLLATFLFAELCISWKSTFKNRRTRKLAARADTA